MEPAATPAPALTPPGRSVRTSSPAPTELLDPQHLTSRRALLRVAGWGALVSALAYGLQPIIVMLIAPPGSEVDFPDVAGLAAQSWQAPLQAGIFVAVGGGFLIAVLAVHRLLRVLGTGVVGVAGTVSGVVSAVSWLMLAGSGLGSASSVGLALAEAAPDPAMQRAVIHGGSIAGWGFVSTAAIGFAAWLVLLGRSGRRSGVIGLPMTVLCWLAVAVVVVPMLIWAQPAGILIMIPLLIALSVRLLMRSRAEAAITAPDNNQGR